MDGEKIGIEVAELVCEEAINGTVKLTDLVPNQRLGKSLSC